MLLAVYNVAMHLNVKLVEPFNCCQQATDRIILVLVLMALAIAFLPSKLLLLMLFLEIFTRNSPPRRVNTEKCTRRLREWWFSIPAAPVVLERDKEDKKKR